MRRAIGVGVAVLALVCQVSAADVSVAVAANFAAPMQKIANAFAQDTGHRAIVSLGSTGHFYAQIRNGAPFEVLLAADGATPRRLEEEGLGVSGSRFTYAVGRLVLWSSHASRVDAQAQVLRQGDFKRLAIANPKLAPYGAAAVEVMGRMGVLSSVQAKLVQGDNIAQTYQFVATDNAQLGFVALSQVMSDGRISRGSAWVVPTHWHTPLRQDAVLLSRGQGHVAAQDLLTYLKSDKVKAIIQSHGYEERAVAR